MIERMAAPKAFDNSQELKVMAREALTYAKEIKW
jgi:hypothetical protein